MGCFVHEVIIVKWENGGSDISDVYVALDKAGKSDQARDDHVRYHDDSKPEEPLKAKLTSGRPVMKTRQSDPAKKRPRNK